MAKMILISDIKIDRELREHYPVSVDELDLSQPIVVQGDRLIDGLRRVEKARALGITELPAEDPQDLREACEVLARLHPTPLKDWLRVYQLMKYLSPLVAVWSKKVRREHLDRIAKKQPTSHNPVKVRDLLVKAFGGVRPGNYEAIIKLVEHGPEDIVEAVLRGELSPSGGKQRAQRRNRFQGRVTGKTEQETLIKEVNQTIRTAVDTIWMLGPINIDKDRYNELLKELRINRRNIATVINQLEEAKRI